MNDAYKAAARASRPADSPGWRQRLRRRIVGRGIQMMCGSADPVDPGVANDIPLFRAAARLVWLKALGFAGIRNFVARSGLGFDFVCHIGDLAGEFPFYHRNAYRSELGLCAAWLQDVHTPVVYDIGANVGFVATHLARMLPASQPRIYAFEPVPTTFAKLAQSVQRLGLDDCICPVATALVDGPGPVRMSYSERNSMLAQVIPGGRDARDGDRLAQADGMTLDAFYSSSRALPNLLKIDVEGSEVAVLRGGQGLLSRPDRPAILFEFNPTTLAECGASVHNLLALLSGYALRYVDDFRGQKIPFGTPIYDVENVDWVCNLFAVPMRDGSAARWASVLKQRGAQP